MKLIGVGLASGCIGNGILGILFSLPFVKSILYNPAYQSEIFITLTPLRNVPVSVIGLIVLSVIPAYFFVTLEPAMPGRDWVSKGLFWGSAIWAMFWLMQEWFVYHTLLQEPLILNLLELALLLVGSLAQGMTIAYFYRKESTALKK